MSLESKKQLEGLLRHPHLNCSISRPCTNGVSRETMDITYLSSPNKKYANSLTRTVSLKNRVILLNSNPQLPQKILLHLLNHIYDNIFISLPKRYEHGVLLELWKLIPHDTCIHLHPNVDRGSKQGILEAFSIAEESSDGICQLALNAIVNFDKEPDLRKVTKDFIERNYQEVAYVTHPNFGSEGYEIAERNQRCPSNYIKVEDHTVVRSNQSSTNSAFQKFVVTKKIVKTVVLTALITTALVCGLFTYFSSFTKTANALVIQLPGDHGSTKGILSVRSYKELQSISKTYPIEYGISLTISLENDENWPENFCLDNAYKIRELRIITGSSYTKILNILNASVAIESLSITSTSASICQSVGNRQTKIQPTVVLPNVHEFTLNIVGECSQFYEVIATKIILTRLKKFRASECMYTAHNTHFLQKIFSSSRGVIKSIEFSNCTWNTLMFGKNSGTYPNVDNLKFDFRSNKHVVQYNKNFPKIFPNLKTLHSTGYLDLNEFFNLAGCTTLIYLKVYIKSCGEETVDLHSIPRYFQHLKCLDLSLRFCESGDGLDCNLTGLEVLDQFLDKFNFSSNC